jgi:trans-aconitate methyltransferase
MTYGSEQASTFGAIPPLYDTARPDYPEALFDDVVAAANLKAGDSVLEIGCGTGKATAHLAARGFAITALDPSGEMIAIAQRNLADLESVSFTATTFEDWRRARAQFKLVAAAQSWHWLAPAKAFARAADALGPRGFLAVFGNVPLSPSGFLRDEFRRIYRQHLGKWGTSPESWYLPDGPFARSLYDSKLFAPGIHKTYTAVWRHTTESYIEFLRGRSYIGRLTPERRESMLRDLAACIAAQGGRFELQLDTHLYLAQKKA